MKVDELTLIPLVTALVMGIKQMPWLQDEKLKWVLPWVSVLISVGLVFLWAGEASGDLLLKGLVFGLSATGLYQGTIDPARKVLVKGTPNA